MVRSRGTNDPVSSLFAAGKEALAAADAAEGKAAKLAYAVSVILGDEDAFGAPVVPTLQWAKSDSAMKSIKDRILLVAECDADSITEAVKAARTGLAGAKARDERRALAALFAKAVQLLGAFAIMEDKHSTAAEWRDEQWRMPVAWFVPNDMEPIGRAGATPRCTFVRTKGTLFVAARKLDGDDDSADVETVKITPTMSEIIARANALIGRTNARGARPEGNAQQGAAGSNGAAGGGDANAGSNAQGGAASGAQARFADPSEARRVLEKEAARDDYKWKPVGKIAEDWQEMLDQLATNNHFRAMMVRATVRAQKERDEEVSAHARDSMPGAQAA